MNHQLPKWYKFVSRNNHFIIPRSIILISSCIILEVNSLQVLIIMLVKVHECKNLGLVFCYISPQLK